MPKLSAASVFLDFDGTLVDLAETPDAVRPAADVAEVLDRLTTASAGRLALVSGRSVGDIAGFLPEYNGIVVGGHGAETLENGRVSRNDAYGSLDLVAALDACRAFAAERPGLLVEDKPTGVVLHYRRAPEASGDVDAFMRDLAERHPIFEFHAAKMAAELRPAGIGKEAAIAGLMERRDWSGTLPVFFGDDATDEPALAWVAEAGGIAVKVGEGDSAAPYRMSGPDDVLATLRLWLEDGSG